MSADFTPRMSKLADEYMKERGFNFNEQFPLSKESRDKRFVKEFPDLSVFGWRLYIACKRLGLSLSNETYNTLLHRIEDHFNDKDDLKDLNQEFVSKLNLWFDGQYVPGKYMVANSEEFAYEIKEFIMGDKYNG